MNTVSLLRAVREIGFNPRRLGLAVRYPRFLRDPRQWKRQGGSVSSMYPILSDWSDEAGAGSGAHFHQGLLVARRLVGFDYYLYGCRAR